MIRVAGVGGERGGVEELKSGRRPKKSDGGPMT